MSEVATEGGKKRKRTGKQREEKKRAAIEVGYRAASADRQAALQAEAAAASVDDVDEGSGAADVQQDGEQPEDQSIKKPSAPVVDFEKISKRIVRPKPSSLTPSPRL